MFLNFQFLDFVFVFSFRGNFFPTLIRQWSTSISVGFLPFGNYPFGFCRFIFETFRFHHQRVFDSDLNLFNLRRGFQSRIWDRGANSVDVKDCSTRRLWTDFTNIKRKEKMVPLTDYRQISELTTTPLLINPVSTASAYTQSEKSSEYFVSVTAIKIAEKTVPFNTTLLKIDGDTRFGGTKINAFTSAFIREAGARNITRVSLVVPFGTCFSTQNVAVTRLGYAVPEIQPVLQSNDVFWRIFGTNSMVSVRDDVKVSLPDSSSILISPRRQGSDSSPTTLRFSVFFKVMPTAFRSFINKMIASKKYMKGGHNIFYLLAYKTSEWKAWLLSTPSSKLFQFPVFAQTVVWRMFLYLVNS